MVTLYFTSVLKSNLRKILLVTGLLLSTGSAAYELPQGLWRTEHATSFDNILLCVSETGVSFTRNPSSNDEANFVATYDQVTVIDDIFIIEFGISNRTFYKLVAALRGRSPNQELIGNLHMYTHGVLHVNVFGAYLNHVSNTCE